MRGIHLAVVAIVILPVLFPSSRVRAQTCSTRSIELDEGNSIPEAGRILIDQRTTGASPPPSDVGEGSFTIELWLKSAPGGQLVPTTGYRSPGQSESDDFDWVAGNIFLDRSVWDPRYPAYGASIHRDEILGVVRFGGPSGTIAGAGVDARYTLQGSRDVLDGAWHHVALVRDASNGRLAIFVDGALDATSSSDFRATTVDVSYPNGAELVGEPSAAANNPERSPFLLLGTEKHDLGVDSPGFRGWLDELRIWDVARGAADIAADYARVVPVGEGGPVASYRFEEGSGLTIFDAGPGPPATLSTGTPPGSDGGWSNDAAPVFRPCKDGDQDGVVDSQDSCLAVANVDQLDVDSDRYGNACDCDFDNNGVCGTLDFQMLLEDFVVSASGMLATDMDGSGQVGFEDFALFQSGFASGEPGPSGLLDTDEDTVVDLLDNCRTVANRSQLDVDGDLFGNACDCDLNQDLTCDINDYEILVGDFIASASGASRADMDGSGQVDVLDFALFIDGFSIGLPGPSGLLDLLE